MEPTKLPINQTSQYNYPQVGFPKKTIILNNGVLTSPNIESQIFRVCNPTDTTVKIWFYLIDKSGDSGMSIPPYGVEYFAIHTDTKIETNGLIEITWLL